MKLWHLTSQLAVCQMILGSGFAQLTGIPTVPYESTGAGLNLDSISAIIVDSRYADAKDDTGATLIPPTLHDFATTFADDLHSSFGINVAVEKGTSSKKHAIFLTLGDGKDYLDAAGRPTSEGYTLEVNKDGIVIAGASSLGAWWGTRTVLQQAIVNEGKKIPSGSGTDAPGWSTRGMMLDCGRHFYPKEFLVDMCAYMSFFKQNTFHVHLSDNIIVPAFTPDNFQDVYARFRLWSDSEAVRGLNNHRNESYSREEFDYIQRKCAARGVTIFPEIEAPGHSLPIVQWKPQVGFKGDLSLLNISHPDTIPTMKAIWKEFLPWFHTKKVSIGADEYKGPEDDYKKFVNAMAEYIGEESGKSISIWGTFPPLKDDDSDTVINPNITIQHWAFVFGNPSQLYIKNNYSVINSDEMYYVVLKDGAYARRVDLSKTFHGDPSNKGPWHPNIFSNTKASDNVAKSEPLIQGAISPMWNDNGANTSVYSEAYYAWKDGLPALADKQWGGELTEEQFAVVFPKFHNRAPGQNLERVVPSKGNLIYDYDFTKNTKDGSKKCTVPDQSPNKYTAKTNCRISEKALDVTPRCSLLTPLSSKGRNYTLSLTLKVDSVDNPTNTTLVSGSDSVLMLTPNITFFAGGNYFRLNDTMPLKQWVTLQVSGRGPQTFASVTSEDGKELVKDAEFLTGIGAYGKGIHWKEMAIEAPVQRVTGWKGQLRRLRLTNDD